MNEARELADELEALFQGGVEQELPEERFNSLALRVFAHQFRHNLPYAYFCRRRGRTPDSVGSWQEIPALPTDAFKAADLTTVPPEEVRVVYHTSGTTLGDAPGRHLLPDTRLYDASLFPNFQAHLVPDRDWIRTGVLGPTLATAPHSSLGHMHSRVLERWGAVGSGVFWSERGPDLDRVQAWLQKACADGEPVLLLGTAFAFVYLVDEMAEGETLALPPGSRLMDTGGYKGRSREVPKAELYADYRALLGLPLTHVVNEYGMTEMGSQFYDRILRDTLAARETETDPGRRVKASPPWVRTLVVEPESLEPLHDPGARGLLRHFDLANLHSVCAILTDDLGELRPGGFEVLGRARGAEARGCSLTDEEFLL